MQLNHGYGTTFGTFACKNKLKNELVLCGLLRNLNFKYQAIPISVGIYNLRTFPISGLNRMFTFADVSRIPFNGLGEGSSP